MTNVEVWNQYKEYSHTTSEIARKIAFAGIALCWLFRDHDYEFPSIVMYSITLLLLFFISDLMQYLVSTLLLKIWIRKEEKILWESAGSLEGNYNKPNWIDFPAFSFFCAKLIFLIFAYILLGVFIF